MHTPRFDPREHWRVVYEQRAPESLSWYAPHLHTSLRLIRQAGVAPGSLALDVGAGASSLPGDLVRRGLRVVAVDLSARALRRAGAPRNLAGRGLAVAADARALPLAAGSVRLWHDRAVLHFLGDEADRACYVAELRRVLAPGGAVVIATFGPQGPDRCSGLPVRRYDARALAELLGPSFDLVHHLTETHVTPSGRQQQFSYALFRRERTADGRHRGALA